MSQTKIKAGGFDVDVITGTTALAEAPASTDEFLISDGGVLKRLDASHIGGTNTPSFSARSSSDQTGINSNVITKINFGTEDVDTDSAFASSRFTVPSGKGGKYFLTSSLTVQTSTGVTNLRLLALRIFKNGSQYDSTQFHHDYRNNYTFVGTVSASLILDLSATDYIEIYVRVLDESDANNSIAVEKNCVFAGYKLL